MNSDNPESDESAGRTFEAALTRLERIIERLEDPDVPLEEAISLVQEGDELARYCERQLREAEGKIVQLVERMGEATLEPLDLEEDS